MSADVIAEFALCETHRLLLFFCGSPFYGAQQAPSSCVRFVPPGPREHLLPFLPFAPALCEENSPCGMMCWYAETLFAIISLSIL